MEGGGGTAWGHETGEGEEGWEGGEGGEGWEGGSEGGSAVGGDTVDAAAAAGSGAGAGAGCSPTYAGSDNGVTSKTSAQNERITLNRSEAFPSTNAALTNSNVRDSNAFRGAP